jgi:hypothetical protein
VKLKDGNKAGGISPVLLLALLIADGLWREMGISGGVTVTALLDGQHKVNSLHYCGRAADLRTHDLPPGHHIGDVAAELRRRLNGDDFVGEWDVVIEGTGTPNEHIHVEHDPHP